MSHLIELEALNLLGSPSVQNKSLEASICYSGNLNWGFENHLLEHLMGILSFVATHMIIHA